MSQIQVRSAMYVTVNGSAVLRSAKGGFNTTQARTSGTTSGVPGGIVVPTTGIDVTFTGLTQPGLCELTNLDATHTVIIGIRDVTTGTFYPLMDLAPGEQYIIRLSQFLGQDLHGTGTGTVHGTSKLHAIALTASVGLLVRAVEA